MRKLIEKYKGNIDLVVGGGLILALLGAAGTLAYNVISDTHERQEKYQAAQQKKIEYRKLYESTLLKYGDKNHDDMITRQEMEIFDADLIRGNNAYIINNQNFKFKTGKKAGQQVPIKTLTKWLSNYKPANTEVPYK